MVYIFFVQPGDMMTFDNEISIMQSVGDLKEKIKERCNIPLEQQVLLISGGEPLDSQKNLCSYMAGTDTNPIFLFSTNFDVTKLDILKNLNYNDSDLKLRLADCLNLPVSLSTVRTRALVAQDYLNVAKNQLEFCESMIHEQHLQQQGWSAVIANLEDISCEFKKRWELFLKMYEDFIADRDVYNNFLLSFEEDKKILQRIPVIETLLEAQKDVMEVSKASETTTSVSETEPSREISLFDWISSSDTKDSLDELYELCKSNLNKFEKEIMPSLEEQIKVTLQSAEKPERREIEGLGKRLYDLEELLRRMKKFVEHQSDMAQSFMQNQNSVAHMKDTSILPDLCATHVQQMELIKQCHQKLMEDRNRIVKAKYELSKSLCARIGWVQTVENKLWELDSYLVYFHEHLQRLRKHLEVFQQLHLAPVTYMNAVVEVVRRRAFSQIFLLWASDLACQQLTIHNEEVTRRKDFSSQFEGHFLNALFPGMEDVPPAFATEAPAMFDAKLPQITEDDVEKLKKQVPDYVENLALPDMSHVVNFFTGKSSAKGKEDKVDDSKAVEDKLIQAVSDVGLASNLDKNLLKATSSESCLVSAPGLPHLKDDKGCESETDTEEFEKVGQSPLELTFPQGVAVGAVPKAAEKQDASTSTEVRNQILPPKKPPRSFRATQSFDTDPLQRTLSISTNESFTNIKNISLDSIDELSSMKNFTSTTDSCFNSHYNQSASRDQINVSTSTSNSSLHLSEVTSSLSRANVASHYQSSLMLSRSKSVSPQSPGDVLFQDANSPQTGHQPDFATDEFYIDESLPSSVGTGNSQASEFVRQLDTANIVVAMLQDNLQISRSEHDKLKSVFVNLSSIARLATTNLRTDLNEFKAQFVNESQILSKQYEDLGNSWETLRLEVDRNEKELAEVMRRENELEKERFRCNLMEKEDVIKRLEEDKRVMEDRIQNTCRQLASLEEQLAKQNSESTKKIEDLLWQLHDKDLDKEKCLKELSETLKMEHRIELDNIKSRFKLMTMERSPSLSSLEKEKSGDFASLPSHAPLLLQMTENFELDKEKAVNEERKRWEKLLDDKTRELQQRFEEEKELLNQDKDKQIDVLRERERNLSLEIVKYKTTIQQLAEYQGGNDSYLQEQVEILKREKEELRAELAKVQKEAAVTVYDEKSGSTQSASEMSPTTSYMSKSDIVSSRAHRLNIDSCKPGDIVLVLWDQTHESFKVLQESKHLYFLHSDSLKNLDLNISDGKPSKIHCTGEVVEKEYCETRKGDNRFKLPAGTKFFLVKVKAVAPVSGSAKSKARPVVELLPKSVEKQLAEDSGIVDYVEQATAAIEDSDRLEEEKEPYSSESQDEIRELQSFEALRKENEQLQEELSKLKSERDALMSTSVALCEGKIDATTSPLATSPPVSSQLSKSDIVSSSRPPRLNIDSCKVGDIVLLLWDQAHENFKVLQESRHTYFLNSDCLERLGLTITEGKPNRTYCTGEVIDKEYCQTRKSENRYKVPKGTKFFRVKVKPIAPTHRDSRDLSQSTCSSRHLSSISTSQSVIAPFDPLIEENPSSTVSERRRSTACETPARVSSEGSQDQSESARCDSETAHSLTESSQIERSGETEPSRPNDEVQPEHVLTTADSSRPKADDHDVLTASGPRHFAEDSGIDEAMAAIEHSDRMFNSRNPSLSNLS